VQHARELHVSNGTSRRARRRRDHRGASSHPGPPAATWQHTAGIAHFASTGVHRSRARGSHLATTGNRGHIDDGTQLKQLATTWTLIAMGAAAGCGSGAEPPAPADAAGPPRPAFVPSRRCPDAVPVWQVGRPAGAVCPDEASGRGLTVIDLTDAWTPVALRPGPDGTAPSYRDAYLALTREDYRHAGADADIAARDRYLELYGIEPSLRVVRDRLADTAGHACNDAIDDAPLAAMTGTVYEDSREVSAARLGRARWGRTWADREVKRRHLADLDALARLGPAFARRVARLRGDEARLAAIRTAQRHLACDGLYDRRTIDGNYTWHTSAPIEVFQRGQMILPTSWLDPDTRAALMADGLERDYRTALRALRERVVAATGLIEDGTAGAGEGTVLGRRLEPEATWRAKGYHPDPGAAPDLISTATESAAIALGWTDPARTLEFLEDHGPASDAPLARIAVVLPPPPPWHHPQMDLSVVIDRGDVWYDPVPIARPIARRPALTLYTTEAGRTIALVRWPTTIGGWQDEKLDAGDIEKRWKDSPVGKRVWKELYVAPTWLPPKGTPDKDLVRQGDDGRWRLKRDVLGPGYRSAFGLIELVHGVPTHRHGQLDYDDEGVRTHGSSNLSSIARGVSHGCHRLLGLDAIRLSGFLLAHRSYERKGEIRTWYRRLVRYRGRFLASLGTRGYLIEFDPPVPVDVLRGHIRSRRKVPYRWR
jgi:Putative peptidoglycan binding domain